jgi:hypothetical protein
LGGGSRVFPTAAERFVKRDQILGHGLLALDHVIFSNVEGTFGL